MVFLKRLFKRLEGNRLSFWGAGIILSLASIGLIVSCQAAGDASIAVTDVAIDNTETIVVMGSTLQLSATVSPANATNKGVTWSSNDENLATVDENGLISPKNFGGPVTITVKSVADNSKSDSIVISVKKSLTSVSYSETSIVTTVGTAITSLTSTVLPAGATGQYIIDPPLPEGLSLDPGTGEISGTLGTAVASAQYTVTFTGNGDYIGTVTANITIEVQYTVGDSGPAGGIVFYDKGSYSDDWRYLEAAKSDQATSVEWGGYGTSVGGTSTDIGNGKANTEKIVKALGDGNYTSDDGSVVELNGNYPAKICDDLVLGGHDDWFLPSKDELNELYKQRTIVGGFASDFYWSSSEYSADYAWGQYFGSGYQGYIHKDGGVRIRAVRAF